MSETQQETHESRVDNISVKFLGAMGVLSILCTFVLLAVRPSVESAVITGVFGVAIGSIIGALGTTLKTSSPRPASFTMETEKAKDNEHIQQKTTNTI